MQFIGFNLTKVSAEKIGQITNPQKNLDFDFIDVSQEKIELLKDKEAFRIKFKHSLSYINDKEKEADKKGEVLFEGNIVLALDKDEAKNLNKAWKKNQIPNQTRLFLSNIILKKCTPRSVQLQEEVGLPSHLPFPRLEMKQE